MGRQIRLLTAVQLCNLFGFNEIRHTKDKKKKRNAAMMSVVWVFVLLCFLGYLLFFLLPTSCLD